MRLLTSRTWFSLAVVLTIALGGLAGPAAAQEQGDCVDSCLEDPGNDAPEVVPGGGVAFETPVVDTDSETFLKAKKAFNEDFEAFLKAKKAF